MTINVVDTYGQHAGKLWQVLHSMPSLPEQKLLEITKLTTDDFYSAVGWLARENKIFKSVNQYSLGETNLTTKIGSHAGRLWRVLDIWGTIDVVSLQRLTRLEDSDLFAALGWLAKEGKIDISRTSSQKQSMRVWLK